MLNLLLNEKFIKKLASKLSWQIQTDMVEMQASQNKKLDLIIDNVEKLHTDMKLMEDRITKKEMTDRMEHGQLKYKIASLESDIRRDRPRPKSKEANNSH